MRRKAATSFSIVRRAIRNQDALLLEKACFEIERLARPGFSDYLFDSLTRTLSQTDCQRMLGACYLLNIFQYKWKKLSNKQKEKLLGFIEASFSSFRDRMALFTISELLGENFCSENAVDVLCKLRSTKKALPRSFVPHGFEHVITDSGNVPLSKRAINQLIEMRNDRSKYVRYEAELSLARVKKHFSWGTSLKDKTSVELVTDSRTSWSYGSESMIRKIRSEAGVSSLSFSENYFSAVRWLTPCCQHCIEVSFKFKNRRGAEPKVSWLRSRWRELDKRKGIPCGRCGKSRKPAWEQLVTRALRLAKQLPSYDKTTRAS